MKTFQSIFFLFAIVLSAANAFTITDSQMGSSFVISQRASDAPRTASPTRTGVSSLHMGGPAKFGIFSPAVYASKIVLGTPRLNKIRGKGISIHSSTIGDFTKWVGAGHMRTKLIKLAKVNGNELGFLV